MMRRILGAVLECLHNPVIRWVDCEVVVPDPSRPLSREGGWNPAEGIIEVPERDPGTAINLHAGSNDLMESRVSKAETDGEAAGHPHTALYASLCPWRLVAFSGS